MVRSTLQLRKVIHITYIIAKKKFTRIGICVLLLVFLQKIYQLVQSLGLTVYGPVDPTAAQSHTYYIYNSKEKVYSYRYLCIALGVFAKEISIGTVVRVDSLWSGRPYSCAKSYILHI